jgi:uncharacterized membrane protein YdjX (TVP38/TMEM64 family)
MRAWYAETMHWVLDHSLANAHPASWVISAFIVVRSMSVIYPPVPGLPIDLLAIRLFGPVMGFAFAECGILLGGSVAFSVARVAGPRIAERVARRWSLAARLKELLPNAGMTPSQQFLRWFFIRLFTNPLFDPISYLSGLTSAGFWPYFLASLLGNIPTTLLLFALEALAPARSPEYTIVVVTLFCAFILYVLTAFLRSAADGN